MTLQPGTRIGPYEVRGLLGAGGMGEVYRAHDLRPGRDVALKTLPAGFVADADRVARFEREARILATLTHPNIATIHGFESEGGVLALVSTMVAVSAGQRLELFPIAGGVARRVPGDSGSWSVVGWIESGLLVSEDPLSVGTVFRVDPGTGRRDTWADIQPQDPAGIMNLNLGSLVVTPDGRGYGYSWRRAVSDLYLVEGWT
jgi:Protein kinase domain